MLKVGRKSVDVDEREGLLRMEEGKGLVIRSLVEFW
jgi:hypothetical protein